MESRAIDSRLFAGLGKEELAEILPAAKKLRFSRGSSVLLQRDRAERMFLLTHGRARQFVITQDGKRILLRWIMPGDIVGGRAILPKLERYLANAEALTSSEFLVWDRRTLGSLTARYPRLLFNILFICDDYLHWFLTAHTALSCFPASQRCAAVLMSIAIAAGQKVSGGIELEITNEVLADASANTVFAVSRFVSAWQRSGIIVKTPRKLLVRSIALLAKQIRK
jgi:CRP-like cAMP-binding protein